MKRLAIIPGDGIGVEVVAQAVRVLERVNDERGLGLEFVEFDWGAEKYLKEGVTLPTGALDSLRKDFDAILFGAVGDPRVPDNRHAADILLGMRFGLDLYANVRPVKLYHEKLCPLKNVRREQINFTVVRENTEGAYINAGGIFKKGMPEEVAIQEEIHTRKGVERVIEFAFDLAEKAGRNKVCMSDKANAMTHAGDLWQRCFKLVAARHESIQPAHLYVDALALLMIQTPSAFEVIVTNNLFGDILTDLAAALQGGLGMAVSGNIHPGQISLFEPVHGSSPALAGKNVANPMGAVLTAALMLDHLGFQEASASIERAVVACVEADETTVDIGGRLGTREVGAAILKRL